MPELSPAIKLYSRHGRRRVPLGHGLGQAPPFIEIRAHGCCPAPPCRARLPQWPLWNSAPTMAAVELCSHGCPPPMFMPMAAIELPLPPGCSAPSAMAVYCQDPFHGRSRAPPTAKIRSPWVPPSSFVVVKLTPEVELGPPWTSSTRSACGQERLLTAHMKEIQFHAFASKQEKPDFGLLGFQ